MPPFLKGKIWWISYADVDGIIRKHSARTTSKRQADLFYAQMKTMVAEQRRQRTLIHVQSGGTIPDDKRTMIQVAKQVWPQAIISHGSVPSKPVSHLKLSGLLKLWIERCEADQMPDIDKIRGRLETVIGMIGGMNKLVEDVSGSDIENFKKRMLTEPLNKRRPGSVYSPATVNRHLAILKGALNLALKRGLISKSPMSGVNLLDEDNERDRICSAAELKKILESADVDLGLATLIAYHTAMRQNEIRLMEWEWISFEERIISIPKWVTKTKEARKVPMDPDVVAALQARNPAAGRLFSDNWDISREFAVVVKKLEIDDLRFHDLRHSAITNMRRRGVDLITIKKISGHKTMQMLMRYNTVDVSDLQATIRKSEKKEEGT